MNTRPLQQACVGIAGVDSSGIYNKANLGIAGNFSSPLRPRLKQMLDDDRVPVGPQGLGDRIANSGWRRACFFLNAHYLCKQGPIPGEVVWKGWAEALFARKYRRLPVNVDSSGFPRWNQLRGKNKSRAVPKWYTREMFLKCINLIDPDMFVVFDEIGDMKATLENYEYTRSLGYGDRCIPVWQIGETWDNSAGAIVTLQGEVTAAVRVAIGNARLAVRNPIFQYLASKSHLIALGGMAHGPCPVEVRHVYLAELCRLLPDHQFWGLGQASASVVNGLGPEGLLDRVWLDGSWWIHNARTENMPVLQDGLIKQVRLENKARTFYKFEAKLTASICSLLGAYDDQWVWPPPAPLPTELNDMDAMMELANRIKPAQMDLWQLLGGEFDQQPPTGTEATE